jgi:hypothetical protein
MLCARRIWDVPVLSMALAARELLMKQILLSWWILKERILLVLLHIPLFKGLCHLALDRVLFKGMHQLLLKQI